MAGSIGEHLRKVKDVGETGLMGDLRDGEIGLLQQHARPVDAGLKLIGERRVSGLLLKQAAEDGVAHPERGGQPAEIDALEGARNDLFARRGDFSRAERHSLEAFTRVKSTRRVISVIMSAKTSGAVSGDVSPTWWAILRISATVSSVAAPRRIGSPGVKKACIRWRA